MGQKAKWRRQEQKNGRELLRDVKHRATSIGFGGEMEASLRPPRKEERTEKKKTRQEG